MDRIAGISTLACYLLAMAGCGSNTTDTLEKEAANARANRPVETSTQSSSLSIEKTQLKLGFIKLTDCAPLVIAKEKGFFDDEGLNVALEAQSNWKVLLDRVIDGQLDGAHMLAGQPIGATIGVGTQSSVITAFSMDYGGNAITVSNEVWQLMKAADPNLQSDNVKRPLSSQLLKPAIEQFKSKGSSFTMGMVFPLSTHNYELRYWLASSGINPGMYTADNVTGNKDAEVLINVTPPPQMPSTMEAGTIQGYCVGEPWNQLAIEKGIGVVLITDQEIWRDNPEKVFGVTKAWNEKNPNTHIAIVKALLRAAKWLDEKSADGSYLNRVEAVDILSQPSYVGADKKVIAASMLGTYRYQSNEVVEQSKFVSFFDSFATYPHYSDCIWYLTQMRRWGQIDQAKPDAWYHSTAKQTYRPDIYRAAFGSLVAEGKFKANERPADDYDGYRAPTDQFIDGKRFDGKKPLEYLKSLELGNKE